MNILEKVGHFISKRGDDVNEQISGKRSFCALITNATDEVLELVGKPIVSYGRCNHFSRLRSGEAGKLSFEHQGEHGGAFEFTLGEQRFFLGQYMRASYSSFFGKDQFVMEFGEKTLKQFYMHMPQHFMGLAGREGRVESERYAAIVRRATCSHSSKVEVLLVSAKNLHIFEELDRLDSLQHLALAEQCGPDLLPSAVFLEEFTALRDSLEHSKLHEQVYAGDHLVSSFLASGLVPGSLEDWQRSRTALGEGRFEQMPHDLLEQHLELCQGLLRSTSLRCGAKLEPFVQELKAQNRWPPTFHLQATKAVAAEPGPSCATNDAIMATHLQQLVASDRTLTRPSLEEAAVAGEDRRLQALVRRCVDASCGALLRRMALLERIDAGLKEVYFKSVSLSRRACNLTQPEELRFEVLCGELFHNLEEHTAAEALLESLGESSGDYKSLSTNSKSGECFFLSSDRTFLVKSVSPAEGRLLCRMLPEYQEHMRCCKASLIVRFAGLYHLEVEKDSWKYFLLMKSVFDPRCEIHAHFDLKGSLYHRKKKEGESCGKDEDWIASRQLLRLSEEQRRELLEAHEADVEFLKRHHVMDYSVLVGIHYPKGAAVSGLVSADGEEVYFLGLIDFLIHFGLRKQAEHLLRSAQGHGHDTSCVDPKDYAARQARFLRSSVLHQPATDPGTLGLLRVQVVAARDLRNADIIGASDPYVTVDLGLQRAKTHAIQDNLNPTWNCSLQLPANRIHMGQEVVFSVWDLDSIRSAQGSDDFLGRLRLPLQRLLQSPVELNEKLEGTSKGQLCVKAWLEQGEAAYAAPAAVWEYAVSGGYERFDPGCQQALEELYEAYKQGGRRSAEVRSGRALVVVDFEAMTQTAAGGRRRQIRRA